jgi:ABC-2 type transport system permease protein
MRSLRTLGAILRFELKQHFRSAVFWLAAVAFFLLAFGAVSSDAVIIGGAVGAVNRNAPYVITQILAVMSVIGVFVTTAFVAGAVVRDYELQAHELFFSTPVTKAAYLGGRFLGATGAALLIFVPVALAILIGGVMPWLDPERIGPILPGAYLGAFLLFVIPNVLLMSAIFFGMATLTRSMMGTYIGVVGFFVAYAIAGTILGDLENRQLGALLDPFGLAAFGLETRYWTTAERNTRLLSASGTLLWNRVLWLSVAVAVLAGTYARFRFALADTHRARKRRRARAVAESETVVTPPLAPPRVAPAYGRAVALRQWRGQTRLEIRRVVRSLPFLIILAFGVLNLIGGSTVMDQLFGTSVHPVTHLILQMIQSSFTLFVLIIATLYAGELVWRERQVGLADVIDALPVPLWVLWTAKLCALLLVVGIVLLVGGLTGVGIQLWQGHTDLEPALYAKGLLLEIGVPFAQIAVLALVAQVLTNQKFVGYLVMILFFISLPVLSALDLDHNLYRYANGPIAAYSDMNGYGPYVTPLFWFGLYWTFAALALLGLVHLFWVRGRETGWRARRALARARLRGPTPALLGLALLGFVATGAWIYYNTNVLNEYVSADTQEERLARYETEYQQYAGLPQPRIAGVYAEVDLYPERRDADIRGRYRLVNRRDVAIERLHLVVPTAGRLDRLDGAGTLEHHDSILGYRIYRLPQPLAPGDSMTLAFDIAVETRGFRNGAPMTELVENGTFFNNYDFFPHVGYTSARELQDPNERRKRGLPPVERMPALGTDSARRDNYISSQSDWIDFETVVSTSPDQIALAPGYLQKEWTENGRRYFHYAMDAPILGFFSYLSADWEVARDRWEDVAIEVYYDRAHPYNVQRMIDAVKKSLDYFTTHFSPYQHRQVRIVEFPRYARFAQSFPNTIPFSESIGFIAQLDDDAAEAIDYVFYVTAHEVAHQWWAHQVIGAGMQGSTIMSETLAQYSALMVMEKEYGPDLMRRFLKYELDRYLAGRGSERIEELPLLRVENQGYVHYAKGSLVMYRLRELLGEQPLNAALSDYIDRTAFTGPPYTTSLEFLEAVRSVAPPGGEAVLEDLFETITLWDVRARTASWTAREDGRYDVVLEYEARKLRATGEGVETEVPFDDLVDIGVFGARSDPRLPHGVPLLVERRRITGPTGRVLLVVDAEPQRAGIDPYNKLIDRNPEDNVMAAARAAAGG